MLLSKFPKKKNELLGQSIHLLDAGDFFSRPMTPDFQVRPYDGAGTLELDSFKSSEPDLHVGHFSLRTLHRRFRVLHIAAG